jgi:cell wall-associated NlpC family hydrolase
MTEKRRRVVRVVATIAIALPAFLGNLSSTSAAPSKADVEAAKAKLAALNQQLSGLVEQYDQTMVALQAAQSKLADARAQEQAAQAAAAKAQADLSARAVEAYTGVGSQVDVLLGASSMTEFSDRLEFMGRLAQNDADLASAAQATAQKAKWAADQYNAAVTQAQKLRDSLSSKVGAIKSAVSQQTALYQQLNKDYQAALAAERAAEAAASAEAANSGGGGGGGSSIPPPPNGTAAQTAIYYAKSVIGTPYVWGAADPSVGFDCSGLVMWSYAHAGISLPHSSAMQYAMLPHVSRDQLAPGDLLFFYSPVSHVAIYLGGNSMIDASHPGPGGEVQIRTIYWDSFTGAGRPT